MNAEVPSIFTQEVEKLESHPERLAAINRHVTNDVLHTDMLTFEILNRAYSQSSLGAYNINQILSLYYRVNRKKIIEAVKKINKDIDLDAYAPGVDGIDSRAGWGSAICQELGLDINIELFAYTGGICITLSNKTSKRE